MIIRKIRNNIVKKIPKDFGSPAVFESYSDGSSESYASNKRVIIEDTAAIAVTPIEAQERDSGTEDREVVAVRKSPQSADNEAQGADVDNREKPSFE